MTINELFEKWVDFSSDKLIHHPYVPVEQQFTTDIISVCKTLMKEIVPEEDNVGKHPTIEDDWFNEGKNYCRSLMLENIEKLGETK